MIRSMTGFGKSEAVIDDTPCSIEVRCVNGRYLELSCRMPKEWSSREGQVRELARDRVARGSLQIYVRRDEQATDTTVRINMDAARSAVAALRAAKAELGLDGDVSLDHLMSVPMLFQGGAEQKDEVDVWPALSAGIGAALDAMNAMRTMEGAELAKDFEARLLALETGLADVEQRSAARIPAERDRLRERVRALVDDEHIDEQRLQLEIVLLSEKLDVSEECVRLRSHIKFYRDTMSETSAVGRKLNFLLQEMNREVNTIGSKTNDADIGRVVVGMKEELERMREQVQNIE